MKLKHVVLILGGTAMTFALVWVRLHIISTSYEINRLSHQELSLQEDCGALSLKINEATSPRKLEALAKTKFGMRPPRPEQVVWLGTAEQ